MNDHGGGGGGDFGGGGFNFGGGHHDAGGHHHGGGHHDVGGHQHHQDSSWNPADPAGPAGISGFDRYGGRVRGSQRYRPVSSGARVTRWIVRLIVVAFLVYVAWHLFAGG